MSRFIIRSRFDYVNAFTGRLSRRISLTADTTQQTANLYAWQRKELGTRTGWHLWFRDADNKITLLRTYETISQASLMQQSRFSEISKVHSKYEPHKLTMHIRSITIISNLWNHERHKTTWRMRHGNLMRRCICNQTVPVTNDKSTLRTYEVPSTMVLDEICIGMWFTPYRHLLPLERSQSFADRDTMMWRQSCRCFLTVTRRRILCEVELHRNSGTPFL